MFDHQRALNAWTSKYAPWLTGLKEDGADGPLTKRRIRDVKWLLGLNGKRSPLWSTSLAWILQHPGRPRRGVRSLPDIARGIIRRRKDKAGHKRPPLMGVTVLDGKPIGAWVAQQVLAVRAAGRWHGYVVSGYRTPAYSESLCVRMCGRPTCPGRCAGRSTNHAHYGLEQGAVDVSDYRVFALEVRRLGLPLTNHLPADPVHFSYGGF